MSQQQNESTISSTDQTMNMSVATNDNIVKLLNFDQKFIATVHSKIYSHTQITQDVMVQFQVNYVTDMNENWGAMINQLTQSLVTQRVPYQNTLKDYFHKILSLDFLPLLRINRHELTQLSLYGFDIYVPPLSALLEIINRIDGLRHAIENYVTNLKDKQTAENKQYHNKQQDIWISLKSGWSSYTYYAALWKLSLNFYILKQYLKIGAKSLVKKDKQIVFTGCNNFFNSIIPILKERRQIWVLCELAELTNQLYTFHPSFSYSSFYSLLLPLKQQYEPIFQPCLKIAEKCQNTYILTPLLFAILRHHQSFFDFIDQIDHHCWAKYLNGLAYGLLINFKTRILEYQQVMKLFKAIVLKLGILSKLEIHIHLRGQISSEWGQARQFFISALKMGYNFGQLQTWHPISQEDIQSQVLKHTRDSLLMHSDLPQQLTSLIGEGQHKQFLEEQLHQLLSSKVGMEEFCNSYNEKLFDRIKGKDSKKLTQSFIRIFNLIKLCKIDDKPIVIAQMFNFVGKIQSQNTQNSYTKLYNQRIREICRYYIKKSVQILQSDHSQMLKESIIAHVTKFSYEQQDLYQLCQLLLYSGTTKQALSQIFSLVQNNNNKIKIVSSLGKWLAANILALYGNSQVQNNETIILKTFNKEYNVPKHIINLNNKFHSCLTYLVEKSIFKNSQLALEILMVLCRVQHWIAIPLLSFPVNFSYETDEQKKDAMKRSLIIQNTNGENNSTMNNAKIQAFSMWLIKNPNHHHQLKALLSYGISNNGLKNNISEYAEQIANITVYEQIVNEINAKLLALSQLDDKQIYQQILNLLFLLKQVISSKQSSTQGIQINNTFYKKFIKLYLRIFDGIQSRIVAINKSSEKQKSMDKDISNKNKDLIEKLISSLSKIYIPILHELFPQNNQVKQWIAYMRKTCAVSLIPPVEGIQKNLYSFSKEYELPSLKKDSAFLIQSSIDYLKQNTNITSSKMNFKQCQSIATKIFSQISEEEPTNQQTDNQLNAEQQLHKYLPSNEQIKKLKSENLTEKQLTKQFVLPSLSRDSIEQFLNYLYSEPNLQQKGEIKTKLFISLLCTSPTNHFRIIQYVIQHLESQKQPKRRQNLIAILTMVGLNKQIVNFDATYLQSLFRFIPHQQHKKCFNGMSQMLDGNCKKLISDGFVVSSLINSSQWESNSEFIRILLKMQPLHFLLTYNQSNWRNAMDWLYNNIGKAHIQPKKNNIYADINSNTSSISSIILQYLQYIRITKANNSDYEKRIRGYIQLLSAYSQLLTLKCTYLESLQKELNLREQKGSSISQSDQGRNKLPSEMSFNKDSSISEISKRTKNTLIVETLIGQEQIKLYHTNQLANMRLFVQYANIREILKRISFFKIQLVNIHNINEEQLQLKYPNIFQLLNSCLKSIEEINTCGNKLAKGSIVIPDFIRSYRFCSDECYTKNKIQTGQYLEDYYTALNIDSQKLIYLMQYTTPIPIIEFMETHCSSLDNYLQFPLGVRISSENIPKEQRNSLKKKYGEVKEHLLKNNVIVIQQGFIDVQVVTDEQGQIQEKYINKVESLLSYFGFLYNFVESSDKLCPLLHQLIKRQIISYELMKPYHKENFHYIKSILIDDQQSLEKSQITFTLKGKQLILNGKEIKVNINNRNIYCNQVAKKSLGNIRMKKLQKFIRGYISLM